MACWINAVLEIENIAFLICHPDVRRDLVKIVAAFAIEFLAKTRYRFQACLILISNF